jgi:antitoxin PrlF
LTLDALHLQQKVRSASMTSSVSAKVTSKGQITLPADLRAELGIKPGDRVRFQKNKDGRFEVVPRQVTAADLRGILKTDIRLSDDDLEAAINSAFGARWERFKGEPDDDDRD